MYNFQNLWIFSICDDDVHDDDDDDGGLGKTYTCMCVVLYKLCIDCGVYAAVTTLPAHFS